MNGSKYPRNRALLVGVIVLLLWSCALNQWAGRDILNSIVVSLLPAAFIASVVWGISLRYKIKISEEEKRAQFLHRADAQEVLNSTIEAYLAEIEAQSSKVHSKEMRIILLNICRHARKVLEKVDEHIPKQRLTAATSVAYRLNLVSRMLPQYLEMQDPDNREYFPNWERLLNKAHTKVANLEGAFKLSVTALENGDIESFDVLLDLMDPLDPVLPI